MDADDDTQSFTHTLDTHLDREMTTKKTKSNLVLVWLSGSIVCLYLTEQVSAPSLLIYAWGKRKPEKKELFHCESYVTFIQRGRRKHKFTQSKSRTN